MFFQDLFQDHKVSGASIVPIFKFVCVLHVVFIAVDSEVRHRGEWRNTLSRFRENRCTASKIDSRAQF
jgi:hypothetical protein